MARRPKPWFWKARRSWFVTLDGKRHNLGREKKAAHDHFHQLMSDPRKRVIRTDSVLAIIDAFLDWCEKHRSPDTYEWYRYRLQRFADTYPDLTAGQLRPFHVQQWLDAMTGLSSGSKRNHCRAIKRAVRWGVQQGYIEQNPIAHLEQPKAGKRETVVSQEVFDEILGLVPDRYFRDLLVTTWETGCRPQESLRVEARHVDLPNSRWVFPETEGKGGTLRIVYLTESALEITKRLMLRFPQGKLFRNSKGIPWTTDAANCVFTRLRIRMGRQSMREADVDVDETEVQKLAGNLAGDHVVNGVTVPKTRGELLVEARRKLRNRMACQQCRQVLAVRSAALVGDTCPRTRSRRADSRCVDGTS